MKLLLTSKAFGNEIVNKKIKDNLNINIETAKVLFIPTALSGLYSYDKYLPEMLSFGFIESNIIIFDEKKSFEFTNLDIDVIYVCGGNTFTLLKLIKECNFDKALLDYINKGIIYIGRSAGSHLLTKNIEHILDFDENYIGLENYDALNLFDGIIFCHYCNERKEHYLKALDQKNYNVYKITDEELIIVNNKEIKII